MNLVRLKEDIKQIYWKEMGESKNWKRTLEFAAKGMEGMTFVKTVVKNLVDPDNEADCVGDDNMKSSLTSDELFIPGKVFVLIRDKSTKGKESQETFTLLKRHEGDHFQDIMLSKNSINGHQLEAYSNALSKIEKTVFNLGK